ncbi:DUF4287 domain-containing protein [Glycocaulis profundi]|nr:DUF4287 domain-containing protein [Glycocaulis profundi]
MSFQGYLDSIQAKTGLGPADFRSRAEAKGFTADGALLVKAGEIVRWLAEDHGLGHGHAMAVYALLKGTRKEGDR